MNLYYRIVETFLMYNFLFFVLSSQVYAQNWIRLEGNELIDVDAYREIDLAVPPRVQKLPKYVDLSPYFPIPDDQGQQSSCSAWASTYALMTYLQYGESTISLSDRNYVFSPSYAYTPSEREICSEPMSLYEALDRLQNIGAVPLSEVPYHSLSCDARSDSKNTELQEIAKNHRISNFERIDLQSSTMRNFLAKGHPILIAIQSDPSFRNFSGSKPFAYQVPSQDLDDNILNKRDGYHAVVLIGYNLEKDTFRLINSWGSQWGEHGYASIKTEALLSRLERAYVVQPFPKKSQHLILPDMTDISSTRFDNQKMEISVLEKTTTKALFHSDCDDIWVSKPVAQIVYSSGTKKGSPLHFSDADFNDGYIVVRGPNGRWICDGGSHKGSPWVVFPAASDGEYTVWFGTDKEGEKIDSTLRIHVQSPSPIRHIDESRNQYHQISKTFEDGSSYEGELLNYKFHGTGTYFFANGDKYKGSWNDGQKHGYGVYSFVNGDMYDGEWVRDRRQGQGKFIYKNGDRYRGFWREGQKHGKGMYVHSNGDKYKGQWLKDQKQGYGKIAYQNGDKYKGQWKDGLQHGKGIYVFATGDRYEGQWQNGKFHGEGIYFYSDGSMRAGQWDSGKLIGQ